MRRDKMVVMAWAAMGLAMIGGAAALAHQLLWTRRLIDLLGASHESSARVLGVFFLGLAMGSAVAAQVLHRIDRPWRFLAWMEGGILLLALPVAFLPWWSGGLWPAMGQDVLVGVVGGWVKLLASIACLLPPSICMGFFVPVAVRELARSGLGDGGWPAIVLYAANTFGGVCGLIFVVGFALHVFGLMGAMIATCGLNGLVVAGCAWLGRSEQVRDVDFERCGDDRRVVMPELSGLGGLWCGVLAFGSGAAVLAVEVLLITLLGLVVPISFYGPAAMLMLVILALGVGAGVVVVPMVRKLNEEMLVAGVMIAGAMALVASPWVFHGLAAKVPWLIHAHSTVSFVMKLTLLVGFSFGIAMIFTGMVFPLVTRMMERTHGGRGARAWGWLLAWNGVGAFVGAELTYRLLLPAAGVHVAFGWVAVGYAVAGVVLAWWFQWRLVAGFGLVFAVVLIFWAMPKLGRLPVVNPHVGFDVRETLTGRDGVVSVVEHPGLGRGILISNQYLLGSTSGRAGQERQAHLPLLLHPAPARVGCLGVATGSTPSGALLHGAVRSLDAVEISPVVVDVARRHFGDLSGSLFRDPRARVVTEDARTWFAASPGCYDVIAADLFQPWGPGEGRLFSREHFEGVRAALDDGGVFCQWLPGYQITRGEFEIILGTFAMVFNRVEIFAVDFGSSSPLIGMVGWNQGGLDWATVERRCAQERDFGNVLDPSMRHADGLRMLHVATFTREDFEGREINTLNNNLIELRAGLRQLRGRGSTGTFQFGEWLGWLRERSDIESLAMRLYEAEYGAFLNRTPLAATDTGRELWMALPESIRGDSAADWSFWPGTLRPR